jgi:hypothetical protein
MEEHCLGMTGIAVRSCIRAPHLNMCMRTASQIDEIKTQINNPYAVDNFITNNNVSELISLFETSNDKIHKNTGPVVVNADLTHPLFLEIIHKLKNIIGEFEITSAFFFRTDYPHIIHNDDTFELPCAYKGITIPLLLEGTFNVFPQLCFFDQFYFHGPAKFFKGDNSIPTYYNKQVYDYADVDGLVDNRFDTATRLRYFSHLKPTWLDGLTLNSALEWKPTTAIIFDSVRLHCASDFRKLGIKSKLGISIFTKRM